MRIVGLTGGIASGKSTLANRFTELGIPVVDTDLIAREIVQPGSPILQQIAAQFGNELVNPDGELDRLRLRQLIFQSPEARKTLEQIMHPAIWAQAERQIATCKANINSPYLVLVVPLLIETASQARVNRILTIEVDRELQLARLMQRDGLSPSEADAILAAQATSADRIQYAQDVIYNAGNLEQLRQQVDAQHEKYLTWVKPD